MMSVNEKLLRNLNSLLIIVCSNYAHFKPQTVKEPIMPHELTKTDSMFSASRVTPWHGLGTVVEDAVDSATAIQLAGLGWKVTYERGSV